MPIALTMVSRFFTIKISSTRRPWPSLMRITSLRVQVYALHLLLLAFREFVPPCAAGVAVVKPFGALARVVMPVQEPGIGIENRDADEEHLGVAGLGDGHADERGPDERAEGRPSTGPAEHLGALGRRIGEHDRVLAEGRRVVCARHQENPEHDPEKSLELLGTCGRQESSEYKGQAATDLSQRRPVHAFAAAYLVE